MGVTEHWLAPAAVVPQQAGTDWLDAVDGESWTGGRGYHRGFSSSFAIRPDKEIWFHWPFQIVAGAQVTGFRLLWETAGEARIGWAVAHHGGSERLPLTERLAKLSGEVVPFEPPELWRDRYPPMNRILSDLPLPTPLTARFGVQLCIMVSGNSGGVVRFYGAAAATGD
ncbi:hypothetical protein [Sphingomonas sp. SUN039]|uniref:hypothetical protein n=1 Tax=Sphingomonas sp. SUN039 TaxID=2937787 RepID=UPI0021640877|nr:hypothetical protein [Sphingomonas sp. SUN039]UVO53104.1 hypothetical protein M0209_02825 [Sphingomonas sp. SUN039]